MANDTRILPFDPSEIEILLAGNIAADDLMWVVRCSVPALHGLFLSPVAWVAALSSLPGWRYVGSDVLAPSPVLTRDFAMLVERTEVLDPDGWVVVQGIDGTNEITVLASRSSAVRSALHTGEVAVATARALGKSLKEALTLTDAEIAAADGDPLGPFWEEIARDPDNPTTFKKHLPVNVVLPARRFYAHFEIIDPFQTPEQTAARVATFALATAFDPVGYARMLAGLDQETLFVDRGSVKPGDPISIEPGGPPTVVYANIDVASGAVAATAGEATIACSILDGPYQPPAPPAPPSSGGTGTTQGSIIKRWGVEPSKTPVP